MNSRKWTTLIASTALIAGLGLASRSLADEKEKPAKEASEKERVTEKRIDVRFVEPGKHWIGVHAIPIADEALKSQLNLQDRLIVIQVLPDSPSDKAGVKQHDILLKFGDHELHTLPDLIKSVNEADEKEAALLILRGGKEHTLMVKPADRPTDDVVARFHELQPHNLRLWLEHAGKMPTDEQGRYVYRMLGPGIIAGAMRKGAEFPNGLSISVSRENEQPAKIVAKKDGKTYETTADKLGELPEDIREHVERLLNNAPPVTWSQDAWKVLRSNENNAAEEVKKAIEYAKKQKDVAEGEANAARRQVERIRIEGGPIDALRKELEFLKKEVESLKRGDKDSKESSGEQKSGKQ